MGRAAALLEGAIIALLTVAAVELSELALGPLTSPPPILTLPVIIAAYRGATRAGLACAFILLAYAILAWRLPGPGWQYADELRFRLALLSIGLPLAAVLVGFLKNRADARFEEVVQSEKDIRGLHDSLEQRTAQLQAALVQAESADRVKSAFLATMSHELRTPLNSILGFTGILLQSLAGPLTPEQHKQLEMVRGSARHLLELINDVLDISKIEAGQMQVHRENFELAPVVERVVASVGPQALARGLTLTSSLPPGPIDMVGDRRRVEQVLTNLLSNAIKFTERGGVMVTVAPIGSDASREPGRCGGMRIQVTDTGIGISPDELPKLFRPFQQVDTGLTRIHEGTGLGLAICSRLVELMGGSIAIESVPGAGTSVTVTLPGPGA